MKTLSKKQLIKIKGGGKRPLTINANIVVDIKLDKTAEAGMNL